jgi:hypothetical protein
MFNLLVTADNGAWEGAPHTFSLGRCVREYTEKSITERYGEFNTASVEALTKLPTIFAYEEPVGKAPKFGKLTQINKRPNRLEVSVNYDLITLPRFLTNAELWAMGSELDLAGWESSRTHWAVKNVDLMQELLSKGIILPPQFETPFLAPAVLARIDITTHVL